MDRTWKAPDLFVVIATVGISGNATGFPTDHLACQVGRGKGLTYSLPKDFFSALGFWRLMTTTLETSGFAAPGAFVPAVKIPSDTASRSQAMAMELIKQNPIPQNVIEAFSNPATFRGECFRLDGATNHLAEIMGSNAGHSRSLTPIPSERHQQTLRGVVTALEWLLRESQWDRRRCFEQLTLHALLPLYISPATEDWESSLKTTMYCLRRVACLSQLCKVLEREGMHEWLEHETRIQIAPQETVEKAFRICLTSLSESYWCSLHPAMDAGSPNTKQREDVGVEKGLWSISLQLTKRTTRLTVPPRLRIGVVSWERVLHHWESFPEQLKNATTPKVESAISHAESPVPFIAESKSSTNPSAGTPAPTNAKTAPVKTVRDHRLAEIRSSSDPQLAKNLERLLQQCKKNQSIFSLVVVKRMEDTSTPVADSVDLGRWQSRFIDAMMAESETADLRGFTTYNEELALVFVDADRAELSNWIRESFSKISAAGNGISMTEVEPLVAGVAMVNGPSRAFAIEQLIEGAWRCLDGASIQGTHAVKTIEVY